jgi:chemotaxis protein MotB
MKRRPHKAPSHERWLVSYADFVTLLFAFFVVLYASSKADSHKQAQFAQAIDAAFRSLGMFPEMGKAGGKFPTLQAQGTDTPMVPVNIVMGEQPISPAVETEDLRAIQRRLEAMLSNQIAEHTVSIHMTRDGLVISLREAGFFDSGSAVPHPATLPVLGQIATALRTTPYDVRIEGHTDNVPIHTALFDSNWELSAARATKLTRIFIEDHNYQPERLSASGYAEFHPVASNDTPEGRAQNRRVDIIVLPHSSLHGDQRVQAAMAWQSIADAEKQKGSPAAAAIPLPRPSR